MLARASDRNRACPPELGLDFELLLYVCRWCEARELRYDLVCSIGAALASVLLLRGELVLACLALAWVLDTLLYKRFEERFRLATQFRRTVYDASAVRARFQVPLSDRERRGLPRLEQNVWAYSGFAPFAAAGFEQGAWSLVVNGSRAARNAPQAAAPSSFETDEILLAVEEAVALIGHPGLRCRDYLVMHGSDLSSLLSADADGSWRSVQRVDLTRSGALGDACDDRARRYKWVQLHDWGGEIVVSSLLFCSRIADEVFVECKHYLMAPVAPRYRRIDALTNNTWWTGLRWAAYRTALAPYDLVSSLLWAVYRPISALPRAMKLHDWWERTTMADEPRYDHGGETSLRRMLAGAVYTHYFQKTDRELLHKLLDRCILDSVLDFFDSRGVDTSGIRVRQHFLQNHGVVMASGPRRASSLWSRTKPRQAYSDGGRGRRSRAPQSPCDLGGCVAISCP